MPRKAFVADLEDLRGRDQINGISNIRAGQEGGEVIFSLATHTGGPKHEITVMLSGKWPNSQYEQDPC